MTAMAVLLGAATAGTAHAEGPCSLTANAARRACRNEAMDGYWIAVGNCNNLSSGDARRTCVMATRTSRGEALADCAAQFEARDLLCDALGDGPYDPPINPASFLSPAATAPQPNPYYPLVPGTTRIYKGGGQTITVTVTNGTKVVQGVTTMVITDLVIDDASGQVIEDTEDYYAQHVDGSVWYFGEIAKNFEDGELVNIEGSWKAGRDSAEAGIIMQAAPTVGNVYRQEFALGNAEDAAEVISTTGSASVPGASCASSCVVTRDFTPISPGADEHKYYAQGVGFILEVDPETGERLELVSVSN